MKKKMENNKTNKGMKSEKNITYLNKRQDGHRL